MTGPIAILGAGGHGRVVADLAEAVGFGPVTMRDGAFPRRGTSGPWRIIGPIEPFDWEERFALAIGDNAARLRILRAAPRPAETLLHPSATISGHADLGAGSVVCMGAALGACARIGAACILNTGASVDHDCHLADGVHVSPGARLAGGVEVGEAAWIGIGAVIREGVRIGPGAMIGAGAAVIRDVAAGARVGGVPAREF